MEAPRVKRGGRERGSRGPCLRFSTPLKVRPHLPPKHTHPHARTDAHSNALASTLASLGGLSELLDISRCRFTRTRRVTLLLSSLVCRGFKRAPQRGARCVAGSQQTPLIRNQPGRGFSGSAYTKRLGGSSYFCLCRCAPGSWG